MNAARHSSDDPTDELSEEQRRSRRVRFEVIFASFWLAFGLFLLPALVYFVGTALLGAYGENATLSTFYGDFYGDMADGAGRVWALALGPVVLMYLLRAIFIGVTAPPAAREQDEDETPPPPRRAPPPRKEPTKRATTRPARVEPRMGND